MPILLAVLAISITFSLSTSASAVSVLTFVKAFPVPDGEGVAFDPATGYVVLTNVNSLEFYDVTTGTLQSTVPVADAVAGGGTLRAVATLPNGNFLVSDSSADRVYEVDGTGATVGGGIDFLTLDPQLDPRGIAILSSNRFFIGDQDTDQITEYDAAGTMLGLQFGDAAIGDCEGLGLSPFGNSLFVADDGTPDQLVEFDLAGNLLGTHDLLALGLTGDIDPEGIAADPATGRLFVSNDSGQPQVAIFQVVPEPSTFALAALALLALGFSAWRRRRRA